MLGFASEKTAPGEHIQKSDRELIRDAILAPYLAKAPQAKDKFVKLYDVCLELGASIESMDHVLNAELLADTSSDISEMTLVAHRLEKTWPELREAHAKGFGGAQIHLITILEEAQKANIDPILFDGMLRFVGSNRIEHAKLNWDDEKERILLPFRRLVPDHEKELRSIFQSALDYQPNLDLESISRILSSAVESLTDGRGANPHDQILGLNDKWPSVVQVEHKGYGPNKHLPGIVVVGRGQVVDHFPEDPSWRPEIPGDSKEFDVRASTQHIDDRTGRLFVAVGPKGVAVLSQPKAAIEKIIRLPGAGYEAKTLLKEGRNVYVAMGAAGIGIVNIDTLDLELSSDLPGTKEHLFTAESFAYDQGRLYIAGGSDQKIYVFDTSEKKLIGYVNTSFEAKNVSVSGGKIRVTGPPDPIRGFNKEENIKLKLRPMSRRNSLLTCILRRFHL